MDNQKKPEQPTDEGWLDELLGPQDQGIEIGPDEQALEGAGLTDPNELELEKLLAEFGSEPTAEEAAVPEAPATVPVEEPIPSANPTDAAAPFQDEEFRDTFGDGKELEELFAPAVPQEEPAQAPSEPEPAPEEEAPKKRKFFWWAKETPKKRRPRHKKGYGLFGIPHLLATFIWLGLAVIIGTTAGNMLWMLGADVLAFEQKPPQNVTIVITEEDTVDTIAQQLKELELIKYPELFKLFAEITGKDQYIAPGTYVLNPPDEETGEIPAIAFDYNALLNSMKQTGPSMKTVTLFFPEGYNCMEIFNKLAENNVCTVEELEEAAANGDLGEWWFLEGVERGSKYCLEGYLFPDTYDFYENDDPERVLQKFLRAFDDRFTDKMRNDFEEMKERFATMMRNRGYGSSYIEEHTLTVRDVVIIASMIEKESPGPLESYTISSVIYNRLSNPNFSTLGIDATVIYANLLATGITENIDYEIDSPYNTYVYGGLPAGPIANPGQGSLNAALNPEETSYYYYALYPGTREHAFFQYSDDFDRFCWEHGYYD